MNRAACPAGLKYAPDGGSCLSFKFNVDTSMMSEEDIALFYGMLKDAIDDDGILYNIVKMDYPETYVRGLGHPGNGIDYFSSTLGKHQLVVSGSKQIPVLTLCNILSFCSYT